MKYLVIEIVAVLLMVGAAFAQANPAPSPTQPSIENQMQEIGCRAERQAAAATIVDLQKQVSQLQEQLKERQPPRLETPKK